MAFPVAQLHVIPAVADLSQREWWIWLALQRKRPKAQSSKGESSTVWILTRFCCFNHRNDSPVQNSGPGFFVAVNLRSDSLREEAIELCAAVQTVVKPWRVNKAESAEE